MISCIREVFRARLSTLLFKMPEVSVKDLSLLSSNLKDAESLITYLNAEINQLVTAFKTQQDNLRIKSLKEENKKLENEINLVKKELVRIQIANGVPQIPIPGEDVDTSVVRTSGENLVKQESISSSHENATESKESKPAKVPKPKKQPAVVGEEPPIDVSRLDIRVGKILHAQVHPDANQLYIEQIEVGEDISRTVVSGLVRHVTLPELDGRMVLVLCNLKPQKMRGIVSEAMVLCASTPETVELLIPPPDAKAGDNITVPGYPRNPDLPYMNPKKKIFEKVAEDLVVNDKKQASYKGIPWQIEGKEGFVTVQALSGCHIR